jgi:tetratricopeptide repeat protein 8
LELAAEATRVAEFKDWWWKARLGKCYYKLGMFRDAEKQFKSAIKEMNTINVNLELCKVYVKLDQPNTAIENYTKALEAHVNDTALMTGIARIYMMMNNVDKSVSMYKKVVLEHFVCLCQCLCWCVDCCVSARRC